MQINEFQKSEARWIDFTLKWIINREVSYVVFEKAFKSLWQSGYVDNVHHWHCTSI